MRNENGIRELNGEKEVAREGHACDEGKGMGDEGRG